MTNKFSGNTHVGYFTEKGCFCLDCLTNGHWGHTDEEVEQMYSEGTIEEIFNVEEDADETCKICGCNLINKTLGTEE